MSAKQNILYLHVGGQKTGSTELQRFFIDNIQWLKEQGIFYPLLGMHLPEQLRLSWASAEFVHNYTNHFTPIFSPEVYWQQLAEDKTLQQSDLLISAEGFYMDFHPKQANQKFNFIKSLFPNHRIKVIVYIREQVALLNSLRNEYLKTGYTDHQLCELTKEQYFLGQIELGVCDHWAWLENMSQQLDSEDLIVRVYERQQLVNNDIVEDFLYSIGLSHHNEIKRQVTDANPRIHNQLAEQLFLALGKELQTIPHRSRNRLCKQLLKVPVPESLVEEVRPFTPFQGLPNFADENEQIRIKYFPELTSLFSAKAPQNSLLQDDGQCHYFARMIADLWIQQEQKVTQLTVQNQQLITQLSSLKGGQAKPADELLATEYEETYFRKNLANIEYQLLVQQTKNVALFAYNDISVAIKANLNLSAVNLVCYIDQKAASQKLTNTQHDLPVLILDNVDFNEVDSVILCTESSTQSMKNALVKSGFKGVVIDYVS